MRRLATAATAVALLCPSAAVAKGFDRLVVVGAEGASAELRSPPDLADSLFDGANRFNRGHVTRTAVPRGAYVRIYPIGSFGHVGVPGRFYPRTDAVCLSWSQAGAPGQPCQRPNRTLRRALRRLAFRLEKFVGPGPALRTLVVHDVRRSVIPNLSVAVELAFDRSLRAAAAERPARCLPMRASWRDDPGRRPRAFCLSPRGVYALGLLYPLGRSPWALAWHNRR
jgi:hypothetical protein